ncbi:zinc finger protein OZF-like [Ochlerotatus camptorhynchus]|uniref:zinc finger protein OZF-like n=1 Tax=Ochlerotatus camptorhynchus TaxID=644619 RepID=UPI0031E43840
MSSCSEIVSMSSNMCRLCLQSSNRLVSVFAKWDDTFIALIITEYTTVQVTENDGLPENICQSCFAKLKDFCEFIRKAKNSDLTLRSMIEKEMKLEKPEVCVSEKDKGIIEPHFTEVSAESVEIKIESKPDDSLSDENRSNDEFEDACDSDWKCKGSDNEEKPLATGNTKISCKQQVKDLALPTFRAIEVDREKWLCCSCLKQFDSREELKVHSHEVHMKDQSVASSKTFVCEFCYRRYSSAIAANAHKRKTDAITVLYECKLCGLIVHEQLKCQQHARTHAKKAVPKQRKAKPTLEELMEKFGRLCCALGCSQSFETEKQLLAHSHSVHKANKVESTLTYNEGKPIECQVCFKRFKQREGLDRHLRFKYKESSNICTLCGAKFPTLTSLTIHERSHTREKPFECEICSKGFGDKQSLKRHYVKHTDEKPFMCSICGVSFKRKRAMQSHMIIHEPGQLPFKCEFCEKRFRVKAKLLYHMRTHTGERPYSCRYCEKSFADFSNRIRHEQSHTGEKPYKCSSCPMGFITRRFMLRHEKKHKRNEAQAEERPPMDNVS